MVGTRWTLTWSERPTEEAALFNPAYCGELIARSTTEYETIRGTSLPLSLAFLVLPLSLHAPTREILPGRSDATLATWAAERRPQIADLPDRALALRPATREAILFAVQHQALVFATAGLRLGAKPYRLSTKRPEATQDAEASRRAAGLLGRWFANQGSAGMVLQAFGLRP